MSNTKKYHFISGLPRSGSTLLSTILNQNPRFTAGISDPLADFVKGKIAAVNSNVGMQDIVPESRLLDLMRSDFDAFYKDDTEVCFNTGRGWAADTPLLKQLYPDFKMIITVRSIPWILDSFERLHRKNPLKIKPLYDHTDWPSVYERSHHLMGQYPDKAARVKGPLDFVQQAVVSEETDNIMFIEYDVLASHPAEVIKMLYEFLGEDLYDHDFNDTEATYDGYDADAKIDGLHTVRKDVEFLPRDTILPKDLFNMYAEYDFWKQEGSPMKSCRFVYAETK